jgi:hypothetical protein
MVTGIERGFRKSARSSRSSFRLTQARRNLDKKDPSLMLRTGLPASYLRIHEIIILVGKKPGSSDSSGSAA